MPRGSARATIVGEAPARRGNRRAFCPTTASGRFLRRLLGDDLMGARAVNLLRRWPGAASSKGAAFPMSLAREAARRIRLPRAPVVLAGRRVAEAFGEGHRPFLEPFELRGRAAVVMPHPSGVCMWWNAPGSRERARQALLSLLLGAA